MFFSRGYILLSSLVCLEQVLSRAFNQRQHLGAKELAK